MSHDERQLHDLRQRAESFGSVSDWLRRLQADRDEDRQLLNALDKTMAGLSAVVESHERQLADTAARAKRISVEVASARTVLRTLAWLAGAAAAGGGIAIGILKVTCG